MKQQLFPKKNTIPQQALEFLEANRGFMLTTLQRVAAKWYIGRDEVEQIAYLAAVELLSSDREHGSMMSGWVCHFRMVAREMYGRERRDLPKSDEMPEQVTDAEQIADECIVDDLLELTDDPELCRLVFIDGMNLSEAAEAMGLSFWSVKFRIGKAKKKLLFILS